MINRCGIRESEYSEARHDGSAHAIPILPNIYTALREQLGLPLEPRTMPVKARVIDHVEMPTPD